MYTIYRVSFLHGTSCAIKCVAMIRFHVFPLIFLFLNQLVSCYGDTIDNSLATQTPVRVESFGAKGDGITDDTKVIN